MKNRLKELRQKNNLTLKQLGEKLNMRDSTLSQYETGKRSPKLKVWEKIADYFGVSTAYLLKIGEEPNKAHLMTKAVIFIYTRSFNEPGIDSVDRYEVDDYRINGSVVETKYCGEKWIFPLTSIMGIEELNNG